MFMNKEDADALAEQQAREIKNLKAMKKSERDSIIKKAQKFNGLIKTIDDLFQHMERLQKCSKCKEDFYDKVCPTCTSSRGKNND